MPESAPSSAAPSVPGSTARDLLPVDALIRKTFLEPLASGDVNPGNDARFLQGVPLFRRLPAGDIPLLARAMTVRHFKAGETVFRQGDKGDCFYTIYSGDANVLVHEANYLKV